MNGRKLMRIGWPSFLAACVLQLVVFALVDPLELQWTGRNGAWSRQAVYAGAFFLFWSATLLSSVLTALLGQPSTEVNQVAD